MNYRNNIYCQLFTTTRILFFYNFKYFMKPYAYLNFSTCLCMHARYSHLESYTPNYIVYYTAIWMVIFSKGRGRRVQGGQWTLSKQKLILLNYKYNTPVLHTYNYWKSLSSLFVNTSPPLKILNPPLLLILIPCSNVLLNYKSQYI